MKELWKLFRTFLKIGAFTFGGGYAMIPLIQKEAVENLPTAYIWISLILFPRPAQFRKYPCSSLSL